jgi:orotidine-5'-phosphate decarboxylase
MSAVDRLVEAQTKNKSMICLGLDLDPRKMPADYNKSLKGMYDFAHRVIEATSDVVCAYKPNMAFYESHGPEGLSLLKWLVEQIPENISIIIDGKRGDIGNTASQYAEALFKKYRADWVTLNPYMGYDSLRPFLEYKDRGIFVLCLTSNSGSKDFQRLIVDGKPLYQVVAEKVAFWNKDDACGLVVGATQPEQLKEIREIAGSMALLIPGVGAQGGSLEKAALFGTDGFKKPAVINVSRSVLYASKESDFAERARAELVRLNSIVEKVRVDGLPPETEEAPKHDQPASETPKTEASVATPPQEVPQQGSSEVANQQQPDRQPDNSQHNPDRGTNSPHS